MATKPMMQMDDAEPIDSVGEEEAKRKIADAARSIIGRMNTEIMERMRRRRVLEEQWIADTRAYWGRYDPTTEKSLSDAKRSTAFVKMTRAKTNAWAARLSDLLFPTDEKNWGIQPTPVPTLARKAKEAVDHAKAGVQLANQQQDPKRAQQIAAMADDFAQAAKDTEAQIEEAKKRCARMETAIDDQLVEADYAVQCRLIIEDACKLGTGVLKGPITSQRLRREWSQGPNGYQLTEKPDPMPEFRRVDPWHFFPDMNASSMDESESEYERHLISKKDLRKLALKLGFDKDATRRILTEGTPISIDNVDQLALLKEIVGDTEAIQNRFVMWEYHGALECEEICTILRAMGREDDARHYEEKQDPLEEHRVTIFFIGNDVLKIEPFYVLDSQDSLYSVFNFERGELSVFGIGVPRMMEHSQRSLNAGWRMMMDNGGLSAGPQILINKERVQPQDGDWGLRPYKVWLMTSASTTSAPENPFQVTNIPNNQNELAGIVELSKSFIDEEASMPQIAQGEQGAASQTLGGMSMLFNSANVVFRRIVKQFDDYLTKPTLRRAYDWNMQFNPDETLKGDMQVEARGSSVLLVREIQSQNLINIITNWSVHPVLGAYIRVREGMVKTLQTMMIAPDDVLFSQDEADERQQKAQEAQAQLQQQQGSDGGAGQSAIEVANIRTQSAERIEQMKLQLAISELASKENMSIAQVQAMLQKAALEIQSKERIKAADIGVEAQRAAEAQARGDDPENAVGVGVG